VKRQKEAADPGAVSTFAELVENVAPHLWRVRVKSQRLDRPGVKPVQSIIPFPADRNLALAVAQFTGEAGRYSCSLICSAKGETYLSERQRLGLHGSHTRMPGASIVVHADDVERAAQSTRAAGGRVPAGKAALDADPELVEIEKQRRMAESRAAIAASEARERKAKTEEGGGQHDAVRQLVDVLRTQQDAPRGGRSDLVAMLGLMQTMMQQNQQSQAQAFQLQIETLRDSNRQLAQALAAKDSAPAPELSVVHNQLQLYRDLRQVFRDEDDGRDDSRTPTERMIENLVEHLAPALAARFGLAPGAVAPAAAAPPPPQLVHHDPATPAPAQAPPSNVGTAEAIARTRTAAFVQAIVVEASIGSDAGAAAEKLSEQIDGLPQLVRSALDRGDWQQALAAIESILGPDAGKQIKDAIAAADGMNSWLADFADCCRSGAA